MNKVNLLMKLSVQRDQRTNQGEVEQHSVKHAMNVYSANFKRMFFLNILFAFIFALPFIVCVFLWQPTATDYIFTKGNYNFIGQVGIGYPGDVSSMTEGYAILFAHYFKMYLPILAASIVPAFLGLAGVFHCMRGYMWGENVRPVKSFFRGIKKLWFPFLMTGLVFAVIMCGVFYGAFWHISLLKAGTATAGSWVLFIFLILLVWILVTMLVFLLPMFACYRFRVGEALKNSAILSIVLWPTALFTAAFTIGVFLISLAGIALSYIITIAMVLLGFSFLVAIWTSYAQKAFGNFIVPQYNTEANGGKIQPNAKRGVNPYKLAKAAKKQQATTAVGKASALRNQANGEKVETLSEKAQVSKNKPQKKYTSYKRKK